MSVIIIPRKHLRQPQGRVEVDWEHPLVEAGGIFSVVHPTGGVMLRNRVAGLLPLVGGLLRPVGNGLALSADGTASDGFLTDTDFDELSGLTQLSSYIEGEFPTTSGAVCGRWGTAAANGGYLVTWSSNQLATVVAPAGTSSAAYHAIRTAGAAAGRVRYGYTWNGGNSAVPYLNGIQSVGSTLYSASVSAIQTVGLPLYFCRHGNVSSGAGNARISAHILGSKAWGAALHSEIADNPWQLFRADPIRLFSLPTSSGLTINSITASSITQTGATITLGLTR